MLRFLLLTLCWTTVSAVLHQSARAVEWQQDVIRPSISKCRSTNMEDFTCYWNPLVSEENVTYTLMYNIGEGDARECPDYLTAGPNTCYWDAKHTGIWEFYCMNVTAHTRTGSVTSSLHCMDVVEIVETEPPFNLSYSVLNRSDEESGHTVLVSWLYPSAPQVNVRWITLEYELRYRRLSEPDNWKVKERLREPHLELIDLPMGSYELMVRCRSDKSSLWSRWSDPIYFTINTGRLPVHMLAVMLVTGIALMTFIIIGFGVIPQGKRIKAYLLSPIPKPQIRGLDPMLIKKGKIDEINHHFSTFHGYKSPQYCMETWYRVSVDSSPAMTLNGFLSYYKHEERSNGTAAYPQQQPYPNGQKSPALYCRGPAEHPTSCCHTSAEVDKLPQNTAGAWPEPSNVHPELVSFPGMDYSMILNSAPVESAAMQPAPQDFYTCVSEVTPGGAVHLVPCLPEPLKNTPYWQYKEGADEKSSQLTALLEKQMLEMLSSSDETNQRECDVPLLPHSAHQN